MYTCGVYDHTHTWQKNPTASIPSSEAKSSKSAANRAQHILSPSHTYARTRRNTHGFSILSIRAAVYLAGGRHCILRPLTGRQKLRFTHTHTHACMQRWRRATLAIARASTHSTAHRHMHTSERAHILALQHIPACRSTPSLRLVPCTHAALSLAHLPPSLPTVRKTWKQPVPVNEPDAAIHRA